MTLARRQVRLAGLPLGVLAVAVGLWWAATTVFGVPSFVLPSPVAVAARLAGNPGLYLRSAAATLEKLLVGGTVGIGAGFAIAVVVAHVPIVRRAVYPYLVAIRVLPKIAIAPLLLTYFGLGFHTAVVFVALVTFFPMVVSSVAGFERVPDRHQALLRTVDAGPVATFVRVRLPYALPDLFAGLKQSVTLAVIGAIVAEWVVATDGLGYLILLASENVTVDVMVAALVVLVALGLSLYGAVAAVQRRVSWWDEG